MWYSKEYNPIQVGSIDGTDIDPHDHAIVRAGLSSCTYLVSCAQQKVRKKFSRAVFFLFCRHTT